MEMKENIRQMIKETDGDSYEKLRSLNQDLTFDYTKKIFEENALSFGLSQKKTLGLIGEDDLYTNLALLLSDQCNHTLKVAVFEGIEKNIFKDRKEFKGSLLKQVTEAYEFINLLNKTEATFEGLTRKDERDYPTETIREALLNAVVHREYSFSGSTLINIYEDRIEFISLGGIISGLSLDSIMLGVSQSRNEKLANIFYRLHFIEAYGTGIKKMFTSYEKIGLKPTIKTEVGAFQVVLPNIHYKKIEEKFNKLNSYLEFSLFFNNETNEINKIKESVKGTEKRSVETLTIFTAIISFIIGNVALFQFIKTFYEALIFILIYVIALSVFVLLIFISTKGFKKIISYWIFLAGFYAVLILLLGGLFCLRYRFEENERKEVEELKKRIENIETQQKTSLENMYQALRKKDNVSGIFFKKDNHFIFEYNKNGSIIHDFYDVTF